MENASNRMKPANHPLPRRKKRWLPDMDLNHDKQIQSLLCYRYTIGQTGADRRLKGLAFQSSRHGKWTNPHPALSHPMGEGEVRNAFVATTNLETIPRVGLASLSHRMGEGRGEGLLN